MLLTLLIHSFENTLTITLFVTSMMLCIEFFNVLTKGHWQAIFTKYSPLKYIFAALLGLFPGCMGAFVAAALFSHRVIPIGALITTMICATGDEAFVMLTTIPHTLLYMYPLLFIIGLIVGWLSDIFLAKYNLNDACHSLTLHSHEPNISFSFKAIIEQWKNPIHIRILLTLFFLLAFFLQVTHKLHVHEESDPIEAGLSFILLITSLIVAIVPNHFLLNHLWRHIVKKHIPKIFLWTFIGLTLTSFLTQSVQIIDYISKNEWLALLLAGVIGIIPQSGPHLVFISLYSENLITFPILLVNSIVQSGHGMLPILSQSRKVFFIVQSILLLTGLIVGAICLILKLT